MYWIGACAGAVLSVPVFKMKQVRAVLLGEEATAPPPAKKDVTEKEAEAEEKKIN